MTLMMTGSVVTRSWPSSLLPCHSLPLTDNLFIVHPDHAGRCAQPHSTPTHLSNRSHLACGVGDDGVGGKITLILPPAARRREYDGCAHPVACPYA